MSKIASWTLSVPGVGDATTYTYGLGEAGGLAVIDLGSDGATTYDIYSLGNGQIAIMDPSLGWYWNFHNGNAMMLWDDSANFVSNAIDMQQCFTLVNLGDGNVQLQFSYSYVIFGTHMSGNGAMAGSPGGWYTDSGAGWDFGTGSVCTVDVSSAGTFTVGGDQLPIFLVSGSGYRLNLAGKNLAGVTVPNGANMQQVNLNGADLSKVAYLGAADFTGAHMQKAILTGQSLSGPTWTSADFTGTDLTGVAKSPQAQLNSAILIGANLTNVDLTGAKLRGAKLNGAILNGTILDGADLTGAVLDGATMNATSLINVVAVSTSFGGCDLSTCKFGDSPTYSRMPTPPTTSPPPRTKFTNATVPYSAISNNWSYLDFTGATIVGIPQSIDSFVADYALMPDRIVLSTQQKPISLIGASFQQTLMTNAILQYANIQGANFYKALLYGCDFSYANLTQASFDGASLLAPTVPPKLRQDPPHTHSVFFTGAIMINTDLSNASADGAVLNGALFLTCPAYGTQTATAAPSMNSAQFQNAVLVQTKFDNAALNGAQFPNATMVGASFIGAILKEDTSNNSTPASFTQADIRGIDASGSEMDGLDMSGATYSTTGGEYTNTSLQDYDGNPIIIAVKYGPTKLGTVTSATQCPNGPPVTDSTGTLVCDLASTPTLTVEAMQGSPRARERTS